MTLENTIERSGLDARHFDASSKLASLHEGFGTSVSPVDGKYYRTHANMDSNISNWLGLETGSQVGDLTPDIFDSAKRMYYGSDLNGKHTLGLQEIHDWKINPEYRSQNIKQHAGYAAEVIGTTKENLINQHNGTGITTYRADDLPDLFKRNDPYVDKVRMDSSGAIIERVQTKFVGDTADSCLSKLMSSKFEKYILDGQVDKIEIPKDFYEDIVSNDLIAQKRADLTQQLSRVTADGKVDVAQKLEANITKLNKLEGMLEGSTVTMQEAIDGVVHPKRTTAKLFAKEVLPGAHETGIKSGLAAAGITLAVSTVDNVSAYIDGEITAEEMVVDIVTETAAAGVIEYGSELISATVSHAMSKSSSALIQKVAGSSLPVAVVSFAVESYDCISDYAQGEIDGGEFAYELGENAASVAGAMKGASIGAAIGSVAGPVGTVAGGIVGGVVGAVVATEVYATAVELGAEGVDILAEQAESLMQGTVELFEETIPEKAAEVKDAFNDFISEFDLPFNL